MADRLWYYAAVHPARGAFVRPGRQSLFWHNSCIVSKSIVIRLSRPPFKPCALLKIKPSESRIALIAPLKV